jgi:hypothetical protein
MSTRNRRCPWWVRNPLARYMDECKAFDERTPEVTVYDDERFIHMLRTDDSMTCHAPSYYVTVTI